MSTYVLFHSEPPCFLIGDNAQPVPFDDPDQAIGAVNEHRMAIAYGYSLLDDGDWSLDNIEWGLS